MVEDKYVGLALAVTSSLAIGSSFVITKKGLNQASERLGFEGDGFRYLRNPIWWGGTLTMVAGEIANFAAYAFAPAILVTPLGALSVLIGSVLGTYFLDEVLGLLGKIGCALCLVGSVVIVLHAPADKDIDNMNEMLRYAMSPVNPLYYVTFTTATILASFILFMGFNTTGAVNTISLLCGFLVIFTGVYLLNLSRGDPEGHKLLSQTEENGVPTDGIAGMQTRHSMQLRRSVDGNAHGRQRSSGSISYLYGGDRERLIHNYEDNGQFGLDDLAEESDEETNGKRTSFDDPRQLNGGANHEPRRPSKVQTFK
ncbi:MAG: hypothetical protein Q9162_002790 [Coniocarpon cinnabarinum]